MKALVIAPQPFFTPRGTPFSVYYRTLVMTEQGVQVDLLTYGQGEDVNLPDVRIIRIPRLRLLGTPRIGPSPLKAFLDLFMIVWTMGLLLRRRYDYVHAHEEAVFWCRWLKPVFRFKLAYDMHSSLPQQLGNFRFTTSKWLVGLFEKLEDGALRHSEAVITICPDLERYARGKGVPAERHFLIENSIFDAVQLRGDSEAAPKPGANGTEVAGLRPNGPRVVYAGTFETYQGLDLLIDAFADVHRRLPEAQLVMVGGTAVQVDAMRRRANQVGLNGSCVFTGRVSKAKATKLLADADVMVSPRREGTNTPLKIYEQLASGKPLVATNIWSHTQVLRDDVCFLVDPEPASMARGLLAALNDRERAERLAAAARHLYDTTYARSAYEQKMQRFLACIREA
ncbi:MAG: glycosyltransferase [Phycisphaeraceae bacterium]